MQIKSEEKTGRTSAGRFDDILQYQGRSALRSDSRIRRKAILEAALRVIERDGVRGVKHRAVAAEAEVPLAATTYYFDDIHSLLHDAFVHYVETHLSTDSARLQEQGVELLKSILGENLGAGTTDMTEENRRRLGQGIVDVLLAHVKSQVDSASERHVEVAFRHEALRNTELAKLVAVPHRLQLEAIRDFFAMLGSPSPLADAQVTMGTLFYLEYNLLLVGGDDEQWALAASTLRRMVEGLLRLPEV
ncbi:TetR/AcrR family transcriptional regulator [Pseudomaricurvus sp.]|uniref:TetR/AcrR family transcriptional regulator n=1 Tax=Pseudomaricurvus sp. TaxID=2004510 RepID=UPI003F6BD6CA